MPLEPPSWWSEKGGWRSAALAPAAFLYGEAVKLRFAAASPYKSALPVICIGNFTIGGAGKTPLATAVAKICLRRGASPAFLTRGYGGAVTGPHWVDVAKDGPAAVGDEPLLLARRAPVMVARRRPDGARLIEESVAKVIIMDDGFQNPSLHKNLSLIAVDAGAGLGNGRVFPAGPLRAPLAFQMRRADAAIIIGGNECHDALANFSGPVLRASIEPCGDAAWLRDRPLAAFCGIGRPQKFFDTLRGLGAQIAAARPFPDHHVYTSAEAAQLLELAQNEGAALVTTEKDFVRMSETSGPLAALKAQTRSLPVSLAFAPGDEAALTALIAGALSGLREGAPPKLSVRGGPCAPNDVSARLPR